MKTLIPFVAVLICFVLSGCTEKGKEIEFISVSYPDGETNLRMWDLGETRLYYGALPQSESVERGVLDIDELYESVADRLHSNVPRENWPDPNAEYGMVQVQFKGEERKYFLIFDESGWAEAVFEKARGNIVENGEL